LAGQRPQLENCIQHMVASIPGLFSTFVELPSMLQNHLMAKRTQLLSLAVGSNPFPKPPGRRTHTSIVPTPNPAAAHVPLNQMERRAILDALAYTKGDRAIAANC